MAELANYPCSLSPNFRHIIAMCCSKFPGNASAVKVEAAVCAEQEAPVLKATARNEAPAKEPKRNRVEVQSWQLWLEARLQQVFVRMARMECQGNQLGMAKICPVEWQS